MSEASFQTDFGICAIRWSEAGLTRFRLPGSPAAEPAADPRAGAWPDWISDLMGRARRHFSGELQDFSDVPLDASQVGDFQLAVYRRTQAIKPGTVGTYGEIARALGLGPGGARAVGTALGANPWPLIVPCHRVVSATGKMTGFSAPGGIRTKTRLLAIERAELLSE